MNRTARKIIQALVGAGATATLWAGRVMASVDPEANSNISNNPAREGAEAARVEGMPAELIGDNGVFTQITRTILYIVGVLSVLMLIVGGIRYITSGGDTKKVTDAKNTVLYAIIGLVIAFFSYAIVEFVLTALDPSSKN